VHKLHHEHIFVAFERFDFFSKAAELANFDGGLARRDEGAAGSRAGLPFSSMDAFEEVEAIALEVGIAKLPAVRVDLFEALRVRGWMGIFIAWDARELNSWRIRPWKSIKAHALFIFCTYPPCMPSLGGDGCCLCNMCPKLEPFLGMALFLFSKGLVCVALPHLPDRSNIRLATR
jgi:hypothetical protein